MEDFYYPTVSIITVNYNGERFLKRLFNSISNLNYPPEKIQAIMVDNGSTDNSCEVVSHRFPWVNIIKLKKNTGYAGGNNKGIKSASGELIALINNDCSVDKNWLLSMVDILTDSSNYSNAGAVSSKVLYYYHYLPLIFSLENEKAIITDICIQPLPGSNNSDLIKSMKFLCGCSQVAAGNLKASSSWEINPYSLIAVPIPDINLDMKIDFNIKSCGSPSDLHVAIKKMNPKESKLNIEDTEEIFSSRIESGQEKLSIIINRDLYKYKKDIINSCGIEVSKSFYARDRGSNSFDSSQFDEVEEVFSPSGSSLLISRKMLNDVGYFDESFFTYYEDLDLFWRARIKGWKTYFAPGSVARHLHCGTGVEWSYSFTYHVIRNRLLAIFKCGWPKLFIKSYLSFIISSLANIFFYLLSILRGHRPKRPDIKARILIFFELFYLIPKKLLLRVKIRNKRNIKVLDREIKKLLLSF